MTFETSSTQVLSAKSFKLLKGSYGATLTILTKSKAVYLFVGMIKQFLSQKLFDRVHVVKSLEELHVALPVDILPAEYGGKERPARNIFGEWVEELSKEENVDYVMTMNKACTDETLRRSDCFYEEYMGMKFDRRLSKCGH